MIGDAAVDIHLQDRLGIHLGKRSQPLQFFTLSCQFGGLRTPTLFAP